MHIITNSRKQGESFLSDDLLGNCCQKCVQILKEKKDNTTDITCVKIVICTLKCLQLIFSTKLIPVKSLGELLGILKYLSYFGLPGQTSLTDIYLYPTLVFPNTLQTQNEERNDPDAVVHPKLRKQKKNKRSRAKRKPQTNEANATVPSEEDSDSKTASSATASPLLNQKFYYSSWTKSSSSDSEFSDAESQLSKLKFYQVSVRQHAYQALHAVIKTTDKKLMFGYWSSFLPDFPAIPGAVFGQNIFTSILKDSSPQVRFNALSLLTEMIRGSKPFLSFADGRSFNQTAFTSLSSILASMISELHRNLLLALLSEKSPSLLTQVLKCYAVLVENVPYKKLKSDILSKLLKHVTPFLQNKDIQVQVACLSIFTSLLNTDQLPEEISNQVLCFDSDLIEIESAVDLYAGPDSSKNQLPWLVHLCKVNVLDDVPLPVRLESLQLLSTLVGKYFSKLKFCISVLEEIIIFCLNENDSSMQLHGAKLLEVLGRCIMNSISTSEIEVEAKISMNSISHLWKNVLPNPLIPCLTNDTQKTLQSVCCDCLSTIPPNIFEDLDVKVHILCITLLLGFASDSNPNVRGAAIRCLGIFSLFPSLSQDISFLSDVAEVLVKAVNDSNLNVRFKASWAFGNLSDALFLNREKSSFENEISIQFFFTTGMACVQFSTDCDRVKANAVRALGNFLKYLPEKFLEQSLVQDFIEKSCSSLKLALAANVMKVCWNSCYALGNMFKNTALISSKILNVEDLLKCLMNVLKSPNFKVRISAVQAITCLPARSNYGTLFPTIWLQLVASLYAAVDDVNFKEIKHQENLCDQICYGICQLGNFITGDDAAVIANGSLEASEILLTSMWKFGQRTIEEKILVVNHSSEHISSLRSVENNSSEVLQFLELFQDLFSQVKMAFCDENTRNL